MIHCVEMDLQENHVWLGLIAQGVHVCWEGNGILHCFWMIPRDNILSWLTVFFLGMHSLDCSLNHATLPIQWSNNVSAILGFAWFLTSAIWNTVCRGRLRLWVSRKKKDGSILMSREPFVKMRHGYASSNDVNSPICLLKLYGYFLNSLETRQQTLRSRQRLSIHLWIYFGYNFSIVNLLRRFNEVS